VCWVSNTLAGDLALEYGYLPANGP
jgi:hypothetical protein